MNNKKNNSNLYNIVDYYMKKGNITKDNVKALVIRFLIMHNKLDEFIKCFRYCNGDDYNLEDIFDDSVYHLFKSGDKIGDYFNMKYVSFDWLKCEYSELCDADVWGQISSEWKVLTKYLRYGGETHEKY